MNSFGFFWNPLVNSIVIGSVSGVSCVVLAAIGAIGFVKLPENWQRRLELPLLWGSFVPALYVSLGLMNLWRDFRFGLFAIVIAHLSMNVGWVLIRTAQRIRTQMNAMQELAVVEGSGAWSFWSGPGVRFLFPSLVNQFRVVFALCFGSFVIPLILGGPGWETIEVAVYREVRTSGPSWMLAAMLVTQFLVVIGLGQETRDVPAQTTESANVTPVAFGKTWFFIFPATISFVGILGVFLGLTHHSFMTVTSWSSKIFVSGLAMVILSLFLWVGVLLWTWFRPRGMVLRIWMGVGSISPVGIGFLLLWLGSHFGLLPFSDISALILATLAYSLLILPLLLRMEIQDDLLRVQSQLDVAESLGANRFQQWTQILLPQLSVPMGRLVGIGAFWGMGEVALMGLLSKSDQTLALEAQATMGAYRLEVATGLVVISILLGGFGYLLNRRMGNVSR